MALRNGQIVEYMGEDCEIIGAWRGFGKMWYELRRIKDNHVFYNIPARDFKT